MHGIAGAVEAMVVSNALLTGLLSFSACRLRKRASDSWMPAASLYFNDPDGNLLEFIAMLPEAQRPEMGIVTWSEWLTG